MNTDVDKDLSKHIAKIFETEEIKQQQANQIAEILNSIKNCHDCPICITCNAYEYAYSNNLCTDFKEKDNLNIID